MAARGTAMALMRRARTGRAGDGRAETAGEERAAREEAVAFARVHAGGPMPTASTPLGRSEARSALSPCW